VALDRAYIDYGKFEELTSRGVIYVTKMKKNLVYQIDEDTAYMTPEGLMEYRVKHVTFTNVSLTLNCIINPQFLL